MRTRAITTAVAVFFLIAGLAVTDAFAAQRGNARGKGQGGPAFCRSGVGHPVHGRQWCLAKGFGLGGFDWRRAALGTIVFRGGPREDQRGRLDERDIAGILEESVLEGILGERGSDRGRLTGAWRGGRNDGVLVLELFDNDIPIAELADTDLDDEVDVVLIVER